MEHENGAISHSQQLCFWEVIMNGDAPAAIASVSGGAEAVIPPKTTEQKIAKRNELKAKSTLLLAIPDEHLLKFHGIKDAKTLWEAIKTRFRGNKESKKMQNTILKQHCKNFAASRSKGLDKTYDRFQKLISKLEIHGEVILQEDANLKLLRSIPPAWNTHTLIMRNKSDLDTSPQLDNEDLKQIDTDDLEEMDLKWVIPVETPANALVVTDGMGYDWSYQAEEGPTDFALMACSSLGSSSSYTEREILNKANIEIIAYQLGLESLEARIVVHQKNKAVFEEDMTFLKYDVKVRDNSITELKNQLEESLKEKDDLKLKLENFETSFKNLTNLINSQISPKEKTGLGYDSQLSERDLNKKSDVFESASDSSVNEGEEDNNQANDRYKAGEGYHAVPPPYNGNFMPPRPDLSFTWLDDSVFKSTISEIVTSVHETEISTSKTSKESIEKPKIVRRNFVPSAVITNSCEVQVNTVRQSLPRAAASTSTVRYVNIATTRPTVNGNPQYTLKDQRIFNSGYSRHMMGNKSFLTDYREIDGGFVAFGGSPKGGKISGKGKIRIEKLDFEDVYFVKELKFNLFSVSQMCDKKNSVLFTKIECLVLSPDFKLLDENQVLLKVLRQNNMYSFDLKNVVPSGGLTCLFAKATIDESNLWHSRLGHINFKTMNKLVKGNLVRGFKTPSYLEILGGICFKETWDKNGTRIEEEVYVCKPHGFKDPHFPNKKDDGIFINQDKYVADILKKFNFTIVKTASTLMEPNKALIKDAEAKYVDVHLYKSMIRSLIYLTASRPDIMFVVCACARDSPFNLEAFSDSDFARASLDRKSTTGEYVVAAKCCEQVLWIQNQMLDYGFNFMNTKIYIDNESTICIVRNPMFHSKIKHIEIRHHFIRDSYEKKLIQVIKIHTDNNVTDLLIKAFDGKGSTVPVESYHTPSDEAASTSVDVRHGRAATTVTSLDAGQSTAVTKLIMKVKKLEKIVKSTKARRRAKIVVSDDEDAAEDTLVQHDAKVLERHE
uniref:Putative ribonuclease H-like domain-containing protein n=1 Tax=Tanacetum cinerariifolium TaxID=118510 RepID=A0A6L2KQG5_TANCI|nr:putative ribonuclease H-like domain-containing protein [Tanacetum cinerariifolium]